MAIRDTDLLAQLTKESGCTVCYSITTLNADLWRTLEPGTPPPQKRLLALEKLVSAGVNAGVLLAPVIPGITDDESSLKEIAHQAAEHGAKFLSGSVLYLKEGTKDHFFSFLEASYPKLVKPYRGLYPGAFPPWRMKQQVGEQIDRLKRTYNLQGSHMMPAAKKASYQLQLAF